jgi:hypothetical protein
MEAGVLRMTAFFHQILGGTFRRADLNERLPVIRVIFAEVSTQTALTIVNHQHR